MGYVTLPSPGVGGLLDMFSKKKKKKAKEKAKAKEKEELKKLEAEEKKISATEEGDPSKRAVGEGVGSRAQSLSFSSIPDWTIYAGAGVVVLGIFLWSRK
jgi:hypothetical protein